MATFHGTISGRFTSRNSDQSCRLFGLPDGRCLYHREEGVFQEFTHVLPSWIFFFHFTRARRSELSQVKIWEAFRIRCIYVYYIC